MQVLIWRVTLIIILLITLVGSVVIVLQEPNLPAIMGVIGAVGSILGAFVTTGLDMSAPQRAHKQPPSNRAPTMQGASLRETVEGQIAPSRQRLNLSALTIAMTFGGLAGILTGVLYADPLWGLPIRCLQWLSYFAVGAIYVVAARNDLQQGKRLSIISGVLGGVVSGLIPSIITSTANQFSKLFFYPDYREALCGYIDCTAGDYVVLVTMGTCIVVFTRTAVAGIGGLVMASLLKER